MIYNSMDDFEVDDVHEAARSVYRPQRLAVSPLGMVSTQHYLATEAGVEILAQGGNAVDAAVTSALALSVCEPYASGLGGQTMAILHIADKRKTIAIDGSSCAPHRATPGIIDRELCRRGYLSTTVPTTPRVLAYILERYGTFSWQRVLEPAAKLAEEGFTVTRLFGFLTRRELKNILGGSASQFFLKNGKYPYRVGERFRQPVLAKTLNRLSEKGVDDFYTGEISKDIHRDMLKNGGLVRKDDLAQVQPPIERRPIACWFDGMRVMTVPPPGAGRTLIEMLNITSSLPKKYRKLDIPENTVVIARIMRQALRDRRDRPFDPAYYAQVSDKRMISTEYARSVAHRISGHGDTTHLSIMDKYGNAIGLTQSIERVYGSCEAGEKLGFLYNNYLMAFEHEDIGHPYYLRPNAVPWASVAPTIIFKAKKPWLVIGSPGSQRIATTIFQVLLRLGRQNPYEAVDAPRLHCNIKGQVSLEASRMRDDIPDTLKKSGFEIDVRDPYSFYLGCIQLALYEKERFLGVADPRRDGSAGGPRR